MYRYPYWNESSGRDHIWVISWILHNVTAIIEHLAEDFYVILMVLLLSQGSFFHGMKVLAMLQRKFGIAWCWSTGETQIQNIITRLLPTGLITGIEFLLIKEVVTRALTRRRILFFQHGKGLNQVLCRWNFGPGISSLAYDVTCLFLIASCFHWRSEYTKIVFAGQGKNGRHFSISMETWGLLMQTGGQRIRMSLTLSI